VLTSTREISGLEPGEILIVPARTSAGRRCFSRPEDGHGFWAVRCRTHVFAREYGIPAVVNLREATRTVKTRRVLLDGDAGRLASACDD